MASGKIFHRTAISLNVQILILQVSKCHHKNSECFRAFSDLVLAASYIFNVSFL